jgi:hypothetical protein
MKDMNRIVTDADGKTAPWGVDRSSGVTTATVTSLSARTISAR